MSKLLKLVANTVIGLMFLSGGVAAAETDISNSIATQDIVDLIPVDLKELQCLASNIFYESGSEPEAGKIAVGVVTLNRVDDPKWPKSVCGVVKQKTTITSQREVTVLEKIKVGLFGRIEERVNRFVVIDRKTICQFSWVCAATARIKETDKRWIESLDVARRLLQGEHEFHRASLGNILYFHATHVKPGWRGLERTTQIGGHVFYAEKK